MQASQDDAGDELQVPLGLPLEVRLPAASSRWRPAGAPVHLQVDSVDVADDGTTVRLMAVGLGAERLRFETAEGGCFEVTVTVTEPLFND